MKKIKILLPLASVATLAGTITPLMTSCGKTVVSDVIPEDLLWIENGTLMGLKSGASIEGYTTLQIPAGIKVINDQAFKDVFKGDNCKVTKIILTNEISIIGSQAFYGCDTINEIDFSAFDTVDQVYGLQLGSEIFDEAAAKRFGLASLSNTTTIANKYLIKRLKAAGVPEPWLYEKSTNKVTVASTTMTAYNAKATFELDFGTSLEQDYTVTTLIERTGGIDNVSVELGDVALTQEANVLSTGTLNAKMVKTDSEQLQDGDFVKFNIQFVAHDENGSFKWRQIVNDLSLTYVFKEVAATNLVISGSSVVYTTSAGPKYTAVVEDQVHEKLYSSVDWAIESQTYEGAASINAETGQLSIQKTDFDNTIKIKAHAKTLNDADVYGYYDVTVVSPNLMVTFEEAGDVTLANADTTAYDFNYNLGDGQGWQSTSATKTITVTKGQTIALRGIDSARARRLWNGSKPIISITSEVNFSLAGSLSGLLNDQDGEIVTPVDPSNYTASVFYQLFKDCDKLTSVSKTFMSNMTWIPYSGCYGMFQNCTSLTQAPDIVATSVNSDACYTMFDGCTSLTKVPTISTKNLSTNCFMGMFNNCTGLKGNNALPASLPASTVPDGAYWTMFQGCTGLTSIPANFLPATSLSQYCYKNMFYGCTGLKTAMDKLPAKTAIANCYESMFQNCTSLTTAPTIEAYSYSGTKCFATMFSGCTSLTYISLPNWTEPINSTNFGSWVNGVPESGGTFYWPAYSTGVRVIWGSNGIPYGWDVVTE